MRHQSLATRHSSTPEPIMSQALVEAQNIVDAAKKRAAELSAQAESAYADAEKAGYKSGVEEGRAAVAEQAVRLMTDCAAIGETLAKEAATLALAISERIIGEHIKVAPETAKKIALRALKESVIGDTVTIYVHPEDKASLEAALPQIRRITTGAAVSIEAEPGIARGGCTVKTEFGEVDASIHSMLAVVSRRLGLHTLD